LCFALLSVFFSLHATATSHIFTLSLHDALPICHGDSSANFTASFTCDLTFWVIASISCSLRILLSMIVFLTNSIGSFILYSSTSSLVRYFCGSDMEWPL